MLDRLSAVAFAAMLAVTVACASKGSSGTAAAHTDRDLILESEISSRAADASNALQVVQKLRPQMLRSRGPTDRNGQSAQPRVYVDNTEYGGLSYLQNVNASQIREIRFVNSRDATTLWGTGHMGGVIQIIMKK